MMTAILLVALGCFLLSLMIITLQRVKKNVILCCNKKIALLLVQKTRFFMIKNPFFYYKNPVF